MGRRQGVVVNQRRAVARLRSAMAATPGKLSRCPSLAQPAGHGRAQNHPGKRDLEHGDGQKARQGHRPQQRCAPRAPERLAADAPDRVQHDGRHRRLDAVEQSRHQRHVAKSDVDPAQSDEDEQRGQHEERARHDAAPGAVHQPADVRGQLLGLRPGQQHAVVQRMQEALLADPAPLLDQLAVHDGNLPGRPSKADEAQLEPEAQRLAESHVRGFFLHRRHAATPVMVSGFQLWVSALASRHQAYSAS